VNVHLPDGETCRVVDEDCPFRPCFRFGFDKGSFTPGVGYTHYYDKPIPVCLTNHLSGCPCVGYTLKCDGCGRSVVEGVPCEHCGSTLTYRLADVLPDPLPCCECPRVAKPRKGTLPYKQKCKSCGTTLSGTRLELARQAGQRRG